MCSFNEAAVYQLRKWRDGPPIGQYLPSSFNEAAVYQLRKWSTGRAKELLERALQ